MRAIKNFFFKVLQCFTGVNFLLHFTAIALSYLIVKSGFDFTYYQNTQMNWLQWILFPAVILGGLGPPIFILSTYIFAKKKKDPRLLKTAYALLEAFLIALIVTSFYKAITGRAHPVGFEINNSEVFKFGFFRGGIFWGWPSGHTTVAFAMSLTLYFLYPKSRFRYFLILYAFYIGIGVSTNIHWFSDFVAGALIGTSVARVISFNNSLN